MSERPDIFLSYSRQDLAVAGKLAAQLAAQGHAVWWDQALQSGETYDEVTEAALKAAKVVLVLWTPASVASRWVRSEATVAQRQGTLLPVMLAPCDRPVMFELVQSLDLSGWTGNSGDPRLATLLAMLARRLGATPPAPAAPAIETAPLRGATTAPDRRLLIGGGVAALAAVGGGAWWWQGRQTAPAPEAGQPLSLVVLPFANLSADPSQAWFADGIAEEIRTTLTQLPGLTVIGRVSSERFRNATDLADVARQLGVRTILTGSVRRAANTIRITAQLIDGSTGAERWSQSYDRPSGDVLAIQQDIAVRVVMALSVRFSDMAGRFQMTGSRNPEAHELFLRAQTMLRFANTEADFREVLPLYDRINVLDPNFAEGWARRAVVFDNLASRSYNAGEARKFRQEQLVNARHAVELSPNSTYPRVSLAVALFRVLDMVGALREAEVALRLPFETASRNNVAIVISRFDPPRAVELSAASLIVEPLAPIALANHAAFQWQAGRFQDSIATAKRAMALSGDQRGGFQLACAQYLAGDSNAAAKALAAALPRPGDDGLRAAIFWKLGQRVESEAALRRLQALDAYISAYWLSVAHVQRDEIEAACTVLEKGLAARCSDLGNILTSPFLAPLFPLPRFQAVLKQIFPADAIAAQARRLGARAS